LTLRLAVGVSLIACLCLGAAWVWGVGFNRSPILVYSAFEYSQNALQYPIYLVDVERNLFSRLGMENPHGGYYPACAADGRIAFTSLRGLTHNRADIYVMDALGREMTQATFDSGTNLYPRWSPDGHYLAFVSSGSMGGGEIYITDLNATAPRRITDGDEIYEQPVWSPDGTQLLFTSYRDSPSNIYAVSLADNNRRRLTEGDAYEWAPAWSPDGKSIAYASNRGGRFDIYLMDSDGGNPRRLAQTPGDDDFPVWSPDSQRLAFVSSPRRVYMVDADGNNLRLLADDLPSNQAPVWSPDGRYLALVSEVRGYADISLIKADGHEPARLIRTRPIDVSAAWCP
jgi:TolB protein